MQDLEDVAVFWDFASTRPASNISGNDIAKNIRITGQIFGTVKSFRCYYDFSAVTSPRAPSLRPELQASGVSLIDCPSTGSRNVASKMMMVDLITHALDHPPPTTFLIITGDMDFGYAIAILRMRKYRVVLLSPPGAHPNLVSQASVNVDWNKAVLELGDEDDITFHPDVPPPEAQPHRSRSQSFAPPPVPEHRDSSEDPINIEARNRSRRNSLFSKPSYDPDRFNVFGDPYNPPKLSNLSDGFSRPHWQSPLRADSAPPMASYANGGMSTHESIGHFRTPEGMGRTPPDPLASYSAWAEKGKGKQREFPFPEPDDLNPFAIPAFRKSSLNRSDTDMAGHEQGRPLRHSPLTPVRQSSPHRGQVPASPRSVKTLSSSSSGSSGFSMVAPPTSTGLTSAEPATQEKGNKVFASTTSAVAPSYTPPAQSVSGTPMAPQQESMPQPAAGPVPLATTTAVDGTATPATVTTTATPAASTTLPATATTAPPATTASWHIPGKPAVVPSVSKPSSSSPKVSPAMPSAGPSTMPSAGPSTMPSAGPSTNVQHPSSKLPVPQKFRTLVDRIRYYKSQEFPNGVPRSVLGTDLPKLEKGIYEKADVSRFAAYIEAARVAGIVTLGTNQKGEGVVSLRSPWPFVD